MSLTQVKIDVGIEAGYDAMAIVEICASALEDDNYKEGSNWALALLLKIAREKISTVHDVAERAKPEEPDTVSRPLAESPGAVPSD